ncbi:MAG: hypothetical protein NC250_00315 [Alistipes senegalensis]|nr:hypothetical protein [Bacteroides cellulosilyticus]MCM1351166.1 hypothetical protein [Alistipes senegalensis]
MKTLGYLLLAASILLVVSGIGGLIYIYLFADAPADGFTQFIAWLNLFNGSLGLVNWHNYYRKKA